eukprot:TRINITY_DN22155_c0_g1_i1.p1 TRINITY_DN22155_c0_g1~~TRINITY_DN22155_c0_g1_i1.p1  ORF type:complete len:301 (-),score=66.97 TRINITY_DN22155_c0_g1_i1:279-1181(-)
MEVIHCVGHTRSWTIDFKAGRKEQSYKDTTEKSYQRIIQRKNLLVSQMEQSKGKNLFALKKQASKSSVTDRVQIEKVTQCKICSSSFQQKPKLLCPTCPRVVCRDCKNSKYCIPLPIPPGKLEVCKKCMATCKRKENRDQFKQLLIEAKEQPFVLWYNSMIMLKSDIDVKMPKFHGLVQTLTAKHSEDEQEPTPFDLVKRIPDLDTLFELQLRATEQLKSLEISYKNFQNRFQRISSYPHTTQREEIIKKYIRVANIHFLEQNLPKFNLLSSRLIAFLDSDEMKAALISYEERLKAKHGT